MVRRGDRGQLARLRPFSQCRIARRTRAVLHIAIIHADIEHTARDAPVRADPRDQRAFLGCLGAQAMVDRRDLDRIAEQVMRQCQQRHAVGPARYCEAQLPVRTQTAKSRFEAR